LAVYRVFIPAAPLPKKLFAMAGFWSSTAVCDHTLRIKQSCGDMTMAVLTGLAFTTVLRAAPRDPVQARRTRFIDGLEQQRLVVAAAQAGTVYVNHRGRAVQPWFFQKAGHWYVQARYGARLITLNGTHNAIVVDSLTAVDTALELLMEATGAGELDAALAQVSSRSSKKASV
jgi:hypothetical protein